MSWNAGIVWLKVSFFFLAGEREELFLVVSVTSGNRIFVLVQLRWF